MMTEKMITLSNRIQYHLQRIQAIVIRLGKIKYTKRIRISEGDAIIQRITTNRTMIDQRTKSGLTCFERMKTIANLVLKDLSLLILLPRTRQNKYTHLGLISVTTIGKLLLIIDLLNSGYSPNPSNLRSISTTMSSNEIASS